jgi:hypothetical protein
MSQLFRRNRNAETAPSVPEPPPSTGVACKVAGCASDNARPCAYRDGRGRGCRTVCCPDHGTSTEGKFYCRRHAGVIRAVGAQQTPQGGA